MGKVAYIDVDDTLIRTVGTKRIPIVNVVARVKGLKSEGWELYCWSRVGAGYANKVALELGLEACFTGFLTKPDLMIDDVPPQSWTFLEVLHPSEVAHSG